MYLCIVNPIFGGGKLGLMLLFRSSCPRLSCLFGLIQLLLHVRSYTAPQHAVSLCLLRTAASQQNICAGFQDCPFHFAISQLSAFPCNAREKGETESSSLSPTIIYIRHIQNKYIINVFLSAGVGGATEPQVPASLRNSMRTTSCSIWSITAAHLGPSANAV